MAMEMAMARNGTPELKAQERAVEDRGVQSERDRYPSPSNFSQKHNSQSTWHQFPIDHPGDLKVSLNAQANPS